MKNSAKNSTWVEGKRLYKKIKIKTSILRIER